MIDRDLRREVHRLRGLVRLGLPLECGEAADAHRLRIGRYRPSEWRQGLEPLPAEDTWRVLPPVVAPTLAAWGLDNEPAGGTVEADSRKVAPPVP
jgi:hypothetical protein